MSNEDKIAKTKYYQHKINTKNRVDKNNNPIEFKLTFEEWFQIWLDSGHWDDRGRKKDSYVMSRINDIGHYEMGNVIIKTASENHNERTWKSKNPSKNYFKNKIGKDHPRSIAVRTPLGVFESIGQAAKAHNITSMTLQYRLKEFPDKYKRI